MAKLPTLMEDILAAPPAPSMWLDALPEDLRADMESVRQSFHDGKLPLKRYQIASRIVQHAKKRGVAMPSQKTVAEWLRSHKDPS
jgi:hypothetical protein